MASKWRGLRGGFARACGQEGNQACTLLRKRTNPGRSRPVRGIRARAQEAKHADSKASNGAHQTEARVRSGARTGTVERKTKETDIFVRIDVDGVGKCDTDTGIPFLEHMLHQIASHGLFDIEVKAKGDIWIDDHHTTEDIALAFGQCLSQALGNRSGINRFGDFTAPLDEALIHVVMDLSGRPHVSCDLNIPAQRVGTFDTELVEHFFQSLSNTSGMTLHIRQLAGVNSHHIIESTFKAFARALRRACEYDERLGAGAVASSKGVLTQK